MTLRDNIMTQAQGYPPFPYGLPPAPGETDCSLFVRDVFASAGVPFPAGVRTAEQERQASIPIGWDDVQPGDLLFFEGTYDAGPPSADGHIASHVGISLGRGTGQMWDAHERTTSSSAAGITTINPSDYWQPKLFEARRHPALVSGVDTGGNPDSGWLEGIDLASYQGQPDWDQIKAAGIAFAIIKATEGTDYVNPTFEYNWTNARRVGIVRAGYHWGKPNLGAADQAQFFLNTVGLLEPTDFLMLDSEEGNGDVGAWTLSCLKLLRAAVGFAPVDYTGRWFSDPHGFPDHPELAEFPLALASYQETVPPAPAPWSKVTIHQYTDEGQIPGIAGNVDRDRFRGTMDQLRALGKPGAPGAAVVDPIREQLDGLINLVGNAYNPDGVVRTALQRVADGKNLTKGEMIQEVTAVIGFLEANRQKAS